MQQPIPGAGPRADRLVRALILITGLCATLVFSSCCLHPVPVTDPLPKVVIDAHTHLFNAHYLPIRGICLANGVPLAAADVLEIIILALTGDSHLGERAAQFETGSVTGRNATAHVRRAKQAATLSRAEVLTELIRPLNLATLQSRLTARHRATLRAFIGRPDALVEPGPDLTAEEIALALERARVFADRHAAVEARGLADLGGYLRFFSIVTSSERDQFGALAATYPAVNLFVDHMMDLQKTYGDDEPTFPFPLQVTKMKALQNENPGRILTFGAFDPFRRADALPAAQHAYEQGVVGFKFYPPDGYRPAGNVIPSITLEGTDQWHGRYDGITGGDLDQWNEAFFLFCIAHDLPIFIHCTPDGFESVKGYGLLMADPKFWKPVLEQERFRKLRLCFGHAGGTGLWFNGDAASAGFGQTVIELCETYDNVYCDAGYWEDVLTDAGVATLQQRLATLFAGHPGLGKKIVYGTDWFMVSQVDNYGAYLARMAQVFAAPSLVIYRDGFFAGNAARYLKLDQLAKDTRLDEGVRAKLAELVQKLPAGWNQP